MLNSTLNTEELQESTPNSVIPLFARPAPEHIRAAQIERIVATYLFVKDYLRSIKHVSTKEQFEIAIRLLRRDVVFLIHGGKARWALKRTVEVDVLIDDCPVRVKCVELDFVEKSAIYELFAPHRLAGSLIKSGSDLLLIRYYAGSADRAEYDRAKFLPGRSNTGSTLNLWTGWPILAKPGNCGLFLRHLEGNICSGDRTHYEFVLDWLAHIFQHPMTKPGSALVFRGEKGVGKTKVAEWASYLLAQYAMRFTKSGLLTGRFNSHQEGKLLFVADEGYYAGDPAAVGSLNSLITDVEDTFEAKGIDARKGQSFCRVIIIGNKVWQVPATEDERRYFVLDAGSAQKQNTAYFAAIDKQMFNGGAQALMHLLLNRQITSDLRNPPRTAALAKQIAHGFDGADRWLMQTLLDGEAAILLGKGHMAHVALSETDWTKVPRRGAYDAMRSMAKHCVCNDTVCAAAMDKVGVKRNERMGSAQGQQRQRALTVPPLLALRKRWESHYKIKLADIGGVQ